MLGEEIFGPLLTVERVPSVEAALEIVDALPFALTGGLFARNPRTIERVARSSPVGNLYVNRAITGARWSGASPSAATGGLGSASRPVAPTTCSSSSMPTS